MPSLNVTITQYLDYQFPLIPLVRGSKCPAAKEWQKASFEAGEFINRNVGTRLGEQVSVNGKEGFLLIVDFDAPDLGTLKRLCSSIPLERTTCVRTGGNHRGYHLFYLTRFETRKRGMLAFESASVDLLGKGSYAVLPPSTAPEPYKYLVGLDEITWLSEDGYNTLLRTLQQWKSVNRLLKHVHARKTTADDAMDELLQNGATPEMQKYFSEHIPVPST